MGEFQGTLACATFATLFWGGLGFALASYLPIPPALQLPLSPTIGWAVHTAVALSVFWLTGMTGSLVVVTAGLSVAAAILAFRKRAKAADDACGQPCVPVWAFAAAAVLAGAIMLAIVPKISDQGVALALPVFDHAKIAIVDDIARLGIPAGNPFFGEVGGVDRLFYYYFWHFSAAELRILTGSNGWNADAGMTGFTALCSLLLVMGFAVWLSGRSRAAGWALVLAASPSIRPILTFLLGWDHTAQIIGDPSGFGAWIFQTTWAPQHVASANCICVAIFLVFQLAHMRSYLATIVLGLVAAAAFACSTWVGGVTFPLAAMVVMSFLLWKRPLRPRHLVLQSALAGVLAVVVVTPLLIEQIRGAMSRGNGFPIEVAFPDLVGDGLSSPARAFLNVSVYWTVFLFVELAAIYPSGLLMARLFASDRLLTRDRRDLAGVFGLLALVGLAVGCFLRSTAAANNDLAWRGVLPSLLVLLSLTAAGLSRYIGSIRPVFLGAILLPLCLGFSDGLINIYNNAVVAPSPSSRRFADSATMWAAVRRHAGPAERVVNNPEFLSDMTRWPVNISWALFADRRSCYAHSDLILPFAPLTKQRREEADLLFKRVFEGKPQDGDVAEMRDRYNCDVVVVTPDDGIWTGDKLTQGGIYRLVEAAPAWRIFRRARER